jgi:hypothetical protein
MLGTVNYLITKDFGYLTEHLSPHDVEAAKHDPQTYTFDFAPGAFAVGDEVSFDVLDPIHNLATNVVKIVPLVLPVPPYKFPPVKFPLGAF